MPPCCSVNVDVLIVTGLTGSLNVADSAFPTGTFVAPLVGTVEVTVGGVVLAVAPVVKVQTG